MNTIHKQTLQAKPVQTVMLPASYKILSIQNQHEQPTLWYSCDADDPLVELEIHGHVTGSRRETGLGTHLATVLFDDGHFVYHFFTYGRTK